MAPPPLQTDGRVQLGPFEVRSDPDDVAAFAAALQLPPGPVPLTFPIRWLALPAVRAAMEAAIGTSNPLLASQAFDFHAGVAPGRAYAFRVDIRRDGAAVPRVTVRAAAGGADGLAVELETVLRAPAAAAAPDDYPAPRSALPEVAVDPIDMPQAVRYAAAAHDHNRLHVDLDYARSVGLDAPIVHGMITMGLFQKALAAWRPHLRVGRLVARFVRPVFLGSRPVIGGRVVQHANRAAADREVVRLTVRVGPRLVCLGEALMLDRPPDHRTLPCNPDRDRS